ncbi:MAG: SDR family NAD(P)-dependent oxidoreductase [Halocynthiibacter sp.]
MSVLKTAIVTGASRGIGAAIAKRLAKDGYAVVVNYRTQGASAQQVCAEIQSQGGTAIAVQGDVTTVAGCDAVVAAAFEKFSRLDVLINNAGWARRAPLAEIDAASMRQQLSINIEGLILMSQAASQDMSPNGRIINITSIAAAGGPEFTVYGATKAAGNAITCSLAHELGPRGITVNAVAPAAVETDLYYEVGLDEFREVSLQNTPLGVAGTCEDVAGAVSFFASPDARWVTGQILRVCGGKSL